MIEFWLQNIEGLSGAINVGKEVQFQFDIYSKDEASAKKMEQDGKVIGVTLLIRYALFDIAKTLRITNQGSNVLVRGTVSPEVIEKLMKNFDYLITR